MKFAIFETKFAKISFLEIFSHKNIILSIINLTNVKRSYAQKHQKRYLIFAFSARYFYTMRSNIYFLKNGKQWQLIKTVSLSHYFAFHVGICRRELERLQDIQKVGSA